MPDPPAKLSLPDPSRAVTCEIFHDDLEGTGIKLYVKREDLIHEFISGNKWRKLKYNLEEANKQGYKKLLTFGGAYSNHVCATAAAGALSGFETIGVIRGESHDELNPTLRFAVENGMSLQYISRQDYREKYSAVNLEKLKKRHGEFYLVPEGGSNGLAMKGCNEMLNELEDEYDLVCLPCGTGGTLAGLLKGLAGKSFVLGFPVLKGGSFLRNEIDKLTREFSGRTYNNYRLNTKYSFGGYAKFNEALINFINGFKEDTGIPLDPVYTGKMMFGIFDLVRNGRLKNMKILVLHTGGLQGIAGFNERFGNIIL